MRQTIRRKSHMMVQTEIYDLNKHSTCINAFIPLTYIRLFRFVCDWSEMPGGRG